MELKQQWDESVSITMANSKFATINKTHLYENRDPFNLNFELFQDGGGSSASRVAAWSIRQCGWREFSIFMFIACWWLGGPPRKLSWGLEAAAIAANRGGAPPPPKSAKDGGRRGRADSLSFSISASCNLFAFARRFWNHIFTWNQLVWLILVVRSAVWHVFLLNNEDKIIKACKLIRW